MENEPMNVLYYYKVYNKEKLLDTRTTKTSFLSLQVETSFASRRSGLNPLPLPSFPDIHLQEILAGGTNATNLSAFRTETGRGGGHRGLVCGVCGREFRHTTDYRRHVMSKHSSAAPQHVCPDCGAAYRWDNSLMRHRRTCKARGGAGGAARAGRGRGDTAGANR